MSDDEGEEKYDNEIDVAPEGDHLRTVVPGYLFLPDHLFEEGRNAYAISLLTNPDGSLPRSWREDFADMRAALKDGVIPSKGTPTVTSFKGGKTSE